MATAAAAAAGRLHEKGGRASRPAKWSNICEGTPASHCPGPTHRCRLLRQARGGGECRTEQRRPAVGRGRMVQAWSKARAVWQRLAGSDSPVWFAGRVLSWEAHEALSGSSDSPTLNHWRSPEEGGRAKGHGGAQHGQCSQASVAAIGRNSQPCEVRACRAGEAHTALLRRW